MDIISATAFTSPINTKMMAMMLVTIVAFRGSLFFAVPFETNQLIPVCGKTLSPPMACKVRGATINEPNADEMVAAANPNGINGTPKSNFTHNELIIYQIGR